MENQIMKSIDFNNLVEGVYLINDEVFKITEVTEDGNISVLIVQEDRTTRLYAKITKEELKELIHWINVAEVTEETEDGVVRHKEFDTIVSLLKLGNMPVYLHGPAGSGKNVLAKQVADALGLKFYYANCVLTKFDLVGYGDANGNYIATPFFKAFTEGGLFMLDEFDASAEEAAITLDAALANRYFDFPVIGNVEAHPDFQIIAAGNTCGRGADEEYTGRSCLDAATLDRFAMVHINYDERVERKIGSAEVVDFIHDLRQSRDEAGIKMILGYRAIDRLAKMEGKFPNSRVLSMAIVKGMDKDEISILVSGLRDQQSKFARALRELAS